MIERERDVNPHQYALNDSFCAIAKSVTVCSTLKHMRKFRIARPCHYLVTWVWRMFMVYINNTSLHYIDRIYCVRQINTAEKISLIINDHTNEYTTVQDNLSYIQFGVFDLHLLPDVIWNWISAEQHSKQRK